MPTKLSKYEQFYLFDDPIPYKDLRIYPALMRDFYPFGWCAQCLMLEKNSIPDPKIISMTYLEYLYYAHSEENSYIAMLDGLLRIVLREPEIEIKYGRNEKNRGIFTIGGKLYDGNDFEEIKTIIIEQNQLDVPDETIQKEVRDKLKEAEEYKAKLSGNKMASVEDQILCVMISSSLSLDAIRGLSIRKFSKLLERVDHKLHYQIYLGASMSGMVTFKDKSALKHWMADLSRDKFGGNVMDVETLRNKVSLADK
jgi:hypothetical protein